MDASDNNSLSEARLGTKVPRKRFSRRAAIIALVWFVICSGSLTLLVRAIQAARETARCQTCGCNLKLLALGLHFFDTASGSLPPAYLCDEKGKPIHSWRALLMPFIGAYSWRRTYSLKEPWDGPNNAKLGLRACSGFQCRSRRDSSWSTVDYVAVVGPDTMWPGRERVGMAGNKDTILLIEMPDSDYRFLEPRSPTVEEFMAKITSPTGKGIRSIHPRGLAYVTVGGDVDWFPPDTDPQTIRKRLKRDPKSTIFPPEDIKKTIEEWEEAAKEPK
jgi:hypothetical protein